MLVAFVEYGVATGYVKIIWRTVHLVSPHVILCLKTLIKLGSDFFMFFFKQYLSVFLDKF